MVNPKPRKCGKKRKGKKANQKKTESKLHLILPEIIGFETENISIGDIFGNDGGCVDGGCVDSTVDGYVDSTVDACIDSTVDACVDGADFHTEFNDLTKNCDVVLKEINNFNKFKNLFAYIISKLESLKESRK